MTNTESPDAQTDSASPSDSGSNSTQAGADTLSPNASGEFAGYDDLPAVARTSSEVDATKVPRYDGDQSAMPDRACWALQNLLTRRYISGDRHPQLWAWVSEYHELLRVRLSELDLRLRLHRELEVAFVEQVGYDSRWGRRLLKRETIHTYDAILALHLAKHVRAARDEHVLITQEEIHELFAGVSNTIDRDVTLFDKRIDHAIDKLEELEILRRQRDDPDTFTVSQAISAIMTASVITDLQQQFEQFIGAGDEPPSPEDDADLDEYRVSDDSDGSADDTDDDDYEEDTDDEGVDW